MFKHILVPTDGSELAQKAVAAGITFAKENGASLTGYYALHEPHFLYNRFGKLDNEIKAELEKRAREVGEKFLAAMGEAAKAAGVKFQSLITISGVPAKGILDAAKKCNCDTIFIATHGRSGVQGLILGSVTQEVLAHATVPVVLFR
jgi:nucleotide-binding universal stress UspA family protein